MTHRERSVVLPGRRNSFIAFPTIENLNPMSQCEDRHVHLAVCNSHARASARLERNAASFDSSIYASLLLTSLTDKDASQPPLCGHIVVMSIPVHFHLCVTASLVITYRL